MKANLTLASVVIVALISLLVGSFCMTPARALASQGFGSDGILSIEEVVKEGDRTLLKVKNRTPFMVIVYVGGVRIGWVRPYRKGLIRGLRPGHHRLYAHTRYGTTSWGPRFIWIPGTWNLMY
jgi:hypothetical protein